MSRRRCRPSFLANLVDVLLPVSTVETLDVERIDVDAVEAANVDVDVVGMASGRVERMDATRLTEAMDRGMCVESVLHERVLSLGQPEAFRSDDEVEVSSLGADGTIARENGFRREVGIDLETHPAAVTTALQSVHGAIRQREPPVQYARYDFE